MCVSPPTVRWLRRGLVTGRGSTATSRPVARFHRSSRLGWAAAESKRSFSSSGTTTKGDTPRRYPSTKLRRAPTVTRPDDSAVSGTPDMIR
ncbi:hypothetical protein KTR9_3306 [Gordonia sp. KTR9]|nr:hypothetical protein KTR9_3306 [Gordonia sp. KTR9]